MSPEELTARATISLALVTLGLSVIAIFQDMLRALVMRPKLQILFYPYPKSSDCHKTRMYLDLNASLETSASDCYYFRLRLKNTGNSSAKEVEVWVEALSQKTADGSFRPILDFSQLMLRTAWLNMPPDVERLFSLFHIVDPNNRPMISRERDLWNKAVDGEPVLCFDTPAYPNNGIHMWGPGEYQITVGAAASNAEVVRRTIEVNLTKSWFGDEGKMLTQGIGIKAL